MRVSRKELLRDTDRKDVQIVGGAADPDKELVDELWRNLEEELPDIGHRMFTWVVIRPKPVTKSHLTHVAELRFLIQESVGNWAKVRGRLSITSTGTY